MLVTVLLAVAGITAFAMPANAYSVTCGAYGSTPSFACVSSTGFTGQRPWGYPVDVNGHNCTNYASYRLSQNGVGNPGNLGYAKDWDDNAARYGFRVDNIPTVGTIAVWEANHFPAYGSGHVAYVEAVTSSYIDISEDNYGGTTMRARYFTGEAAWPDHFIHFKDVSAVVAPPSVPDTDGDSVNDNNDACLAIVGASSNRGCRLDDHTVSGNFYGNDSYTDAVTFYDYGANNLGLLLSKGGAEGLDRPVTIWDTGQGHWYWGRSQFFAGNFAGNDAYTDVIGLYDYGNATLGAFLFQGNGNGVMQPQFLWTTNSGTWNLANAKYVVGNFYGNDGKDDLMAFYGYADNSQATFVFPGSGAGIGQPQYQWASGPQQWIVGSAEYVASDFAGNDGLTDVIALYQYPGGNMGAFLFQGSNTLIGQPQNLWTTGPGAWNNSSAQFFAGNFYGNDSEMDIVALYDLGNANMGAYVFPGVSGGVGQFQNLWTTGVGQWYKSNTKAVAGRFSGPATSLFALYNYGGSNTGGHLMASTNAGTVGTPVSKWATGAGQLNWLCM